MANCEKLLWMKKSEKGFTLMEVMIAITILAIALVAVYQSQSQSISMTSNSRFLTTAALLAQSKMTEIEILEPDRISSGSGDFDEDFPDYTWRVDISDTQIDLLKKIEVSVTNNKMTSNNTYELVLYKVIRK
jgi:general secretion pathway protein I